MKRFFATFLQKFPILINLSAHNIFSLFTDFDMAIGKILSVKMLCTEMIAVVIEIVIYMCLKYLTCEKLLG